MKRVILVIILLIIGIGAYFGITMYLNSNNNNSNTISNSGSLVKEANEIIYTVTEVERLEELPDEMEPDAGNEFLLLTIYGENFDVLSRNYNVFYFTIKDESGKSYNNSINTDNHAFSYGELEPGGNFTGTIVFEIPKNSKGDLVITDEDFNEIQSIEVR